MTSSAASPPSDAADRSGPKRAQAFALVSCGLIALISISAWWCWRNGWVLYYGDAASHLNISRAVIDSRTPGYDQLGRVWLPMLHVLCLPFAGSDRLWSSGLAGTLPVAGCFIIAGACFYLAALEAYQRISAAVVAVACFVFNPNLLYLATIPMTEVVFLAGIAVVLLAELRFRNTQRLRWIGVGVFASWWLTLTRYDGWFLIPFIAGWFALNRNGRSMRRVFTFACAAAAASLAPVYWMAHNWYETGNALDFYNGQYSAAAIQGGKPYPGDHDWLAAVHYYFTAGRLCIGLPLLFLALAGLFFAIRRQAWGPFCFLLLTPVFYVWSMHSSRGTPIYLPTLWPFSYYNSRYGIACLPLCAFAAGALVFALPARPKTLTWMLPILAVLPWIMHPSPQNWICWKESEVNSVDRRAWSDAAARFLRARYQTGQGILTSTGDVTAVYCSLGIHLSETLNIGNGAEWLLATTRPDLYHPNKWLVMQSGDGLSETLARNKRAPYTEMLVIVTSKFSPPLTISRRSKP